MCHDRISLVELRALCSMSVHMPFEKISSDKSPCAVRKSTVVGLFRVMVKLMPVPVICQHGALSVAQTRDIQMFRS